MDGPGHIPCSVMVGSGTCLHPAGLGGPFSISGVCAYPIHRVMSCSWWTGTPPNLYPNLQDGCRCRIRPWRNTEYVPGRQFAIFIQVSNRGRNGCIKSWFCQYISIPMKYTISDSTLQYKLGLTLSFLSLISRGVYGNQKGNTSTVYCVYSVNL